MATSPIQFEKSCLKTLTAVEADRNRSNQHEFQGVTPLIGVFGRMRLSSSAQFSIRGRDESYPVALTWYDARENKPHRSSEFRLYFQSNPVMVLAREGDNIIIGLDKNNNIHCVLIQSSSPDHRRSTNWLIE
jgi:hypothetical protein